MEDLGVITVNVAGGQNAATGPVSTGPASGASSPGAIDRIRDITAKILEGMRKTDGSPRAQSDRAQQAAAQAGNRLRTISDNFRSGMRDWKGQMAAQARRLGGRAWEATKGWSDRAGGKMGSVARGAVKGIQGLGAIASKAGMLLSRLAGPIGMVIGIFTSAYKTIDKAVAWVSDRISGRNAHMAMVEAEHKYAVEEQTRRISQSMGRDASQWERMKNKWSILGDEVKAAVSQPFVSAGGWFGENVGTPMAEGITGGVRNLKYMSPQMVGASWRALWSVNLSEMKFDMTEIKKLMEEQDKREAIKAARDAEFSAANAAFLEDIALAGGSPRFSRQLLGSMDPASRTRMIESWASNGVRR